MSRLATAFAALTLACASSPGGIPEQPPTETVQVSRQAVSAAGGRVVLTNNTVPVTTVVGASSDAVWKVLPGVLDELGLPVTVVDPPTSTIGNGGFTAHHRLANTSLSRYIECGTTQIGPNADSYDIYIVYFVQVRREGESSASVTTGFNASAKPVAFAGGYSDCSSKHLLESRITDGVKARLKVR